MARFVAFLRGVMPMNSNMASLRRCFEGAGFTNVKTVLASGNVVFDTRSRSEAALIRRIEAAMEKDLGRTFRTILRSSSALEELIASDPFTAFRVPKDAKRVVTFLDERPRGRLQLPVEVGGACVHGVRGREAFVSYVATPNGPVFMTLIEKTFGKNVTTRTWDTVLKCARA
jgi:uncharacterized protein (DUF1697 family)